MSKRRVGASGRIVADPSLDVRPNSSVGDKADAMPRAVLTVLLSLVLVARYRCVCCLGTCPAPRTRRGDHRHRDARALRRRRRRGRLGRRPGHLGRTPATHEDSIVIATAKEGGLRVYDLDGAELQSLDGDPAPRADGVTGRYNNVDIAYGLDLGGRPDRRGRRLGPLQRPAALLRDRPGRRGGGHAGAARSPRRAGLPLNPIATGSTTSRPRTGSPSSSRRARAGVAVVTRRARRPWRPPSSRSERTRRLHRGRTVDFPASSRSPTARPGSRAKSPASGRSSRG